MNTAILVVNTLCIAFQLHIILARVRHTEALTQALARKEGILNAVTR